MFGLFSDFVTAVAEIDCTKDYGSDYFESEPTFIRSTKIGLYRECAEKRFSRFAYKFKIKKVQRPHIVSIEYPDDRERTFCVMDGRTYDLSTGIATGREMPLSGRTMEHPIIFWPRWNDCTIMFITWDGRAPAAVSKIKIYELDEKYFENARSLKRAEGFRRIGFQWEDPCGRYQTMGARKKPEWSRRVAAYAAAIGQNIIKYPITWYWGCLYPSDVDATDYLEGLVDNKSNLYINAISETYDWVAEAIEEFGKCGIDFMGVFHAYRFYKLMLSMNTDTASIIEGKDTINNVMFDGSVQRSSNDWTRTWTRLNIPFMAEGEKTQDAEAFKAKQLMGEPMFGSGGIHGPIFNCLHPAVQKHLMLLMRELRRKYASYPNFKGITVPLWGPTFLWYGSLKAGYDDYTFSLFERETALAAGIPKNDPRRFEKRFEWVRSRHRREWIDWRCSKIKGLLARMRDELAGDRKDIRLVISPCREPLLGHLFGFSYDTDEMQLCNRGDLYSILREGGIDMKLFGGSDGVEIELQNDPYRDRSFEIHSGKTPNTNALRDHDFLDTKTNSLVAEGENRSVFIFNCYYESGRYVIGKVKGDIPEELRDAGSGPGELYRLYLVFDHPTWGWFEHEFTTCPGVPASGRNFLEYYAHAVAAIDAKEITFGGLLIGTYGHEEELRQFSNAFTSLPSEKFETLAGNSDVVVLRRLEKGEDIYFYIVNTEPTDIEVSVAFDEEKAVVLELGKENPREFKLSDYSLSCKLQSYELKAYRVISGAKPVHIHIKPAGELSERIRKAEGMLSRANSIKDGGRWLSWLIEELNDCIDNSRHGRLRHIFRSYPAGRLEFIRFLTNRND